MDEFEEVREREEDFAFEGRSRCRFFERAEAGDPGRGERTAEDVEAFEVEAEADFEEEGRGDSAF
jgi:hypothetical protein